MNCGGDVYDEDHFQRSMMIKINIDIPKSCWDCPFNFPTFGYSWCCLKIEYSWTETGEKPDWCPLEECEEE